MVMKTRLYIFLSVLASLLAPSLLHAQTAGFTADVDSGCAPLVVHFTNTSTGATSYHWDLGNGTTSALTDVSGSYLTPGTYTATLIAYNGTSTSTKTMTITVFPSPTVSFVAPDTAVCPGTAVNFVSTTVAGVPGALTYIWNFGDGSTSTATSPGHVFPGPGYYNITLFATNAKGCQSSATYGGYVHVYTAPTASFSAPVTTFCNPPGAATFTSGTSGTAPFTYAWTFGDGATSTLADPSHTYAATGTYSVRLVVTDGHGCMDTFNWAHYITVTQLAASFNSVTTACVNSWVSFHNSSTPYGNCTWYFGDGDTSTADSPSHFYTTTGTFTVKLVIQTGPCTDTVTHTIIITPGPTMGIVPTPAEPCPAPVSISFDGTGVPAGATVNWTFSDGGTGSGNPDSHSFATNGVFSVGMYVALSDGCKDTLYRYDTIYNLYLNVVDTPKSGCVPLTVPFSVSAGTTVPLGLPATYPYGIASYSWSFGDGSAVSTAPTPTHTYTAPGIYHGTITVTTANGCTVMDTFIIRVGVPPVASFYATPTTVCADRAVTFISTSTGTITDYYWQFGDGGSVIDSTPATTHIYTMPGTYSVTLIVYDNGCPSLPITLTNYITVDSPKALFIDTFICAPPTSVGFIDQSIGADSLRWYFGDGTSSTLTNPTHNFPTLGIYTVTLTTYNVLSGCRDTTTQVVNLFHPTVVMAADDTAICQWGVVNFSPTITGGTATQYTWLIDSTFVSGYPGPNIFTDTFKSTGWYSVSVVILDQHGCLDTFTRSHYILVAKPTDNFTVAPPAGCKPLTVTFTDGSTDVPGAFITTYTWMFGDGNSSTVTTPVTTHTYTMAGTFPVEEIVTDNIGCKDTLTKPSLITVTSPQAVFSANTFFPCINQTVTFTNLSTGIVSSFWIFGDGDTANTTSTNHAYAATGIYTVKLVVIDANGCTDTATYLNYITVTQPTASFYMNDSFTICIPLEVNFYNTSTGAASYQWSFGNGDHSVAVDPAELYVANGYDTVALVATNAYGCTDTAYGHVNIYGYAGEFSYTPDSGCTPLRVFFNAGLLNVPNIIWDFADGITSSPTTSDTISHVYIVPGKYVPKLILSDNTGCQNSSMGKDTIKVDAVLAGFTTLPHPVCLGEPMQFEDTSFSYFSTVHTQIWTINGGDTTSIAMPTYTFDSLGTYPVTLTATDGWGCTAGMSGTVTVFPPPVITVSPDTTVCIGDAATLYGYGGVSYTWSPGATLSCTACNPTHATPTVPTQYFVTGTDHNGCKGTDSVVVHIRTKTTSGAMGSGYICYGQSLQLNDTGATKFTWIPTTGLNAWNIADPIASPYSTITYTVVAQLGNCTPDTNYVNVVVHPLPQIDAGPDQTIVDGASALIKGTGTSIATITWTPSQTLSCDSCLNPTSTPPTTTTYTVSVSSEYGCLASDSVTIKVICDASQVFMPNAFTPNNDGNNDVYYPRGSGISIIRSFRIYNRWGELLFERSNIQINDESNAWNGSYNGGEPRPDVYVYVVEAVCANGQSVSLKGDVTIIK